MTALDAHRRVAEGSQILFASDPAGTVIADHVHERSCWADGGYRNVHVGLQRLREVLDLTGPPPARPATLVG